jgi:hypothetical protein
MVKCPPMMHQCPSIDTLYGTIIYLMVRINDAAEPLPHHCVPLFFLERLIAFLEFLHTSCTKTTTLIEGPCVGLWDPMWVP